MNSVFNINTKVIVRFWIGVSVGKLRLQEHAVINYVMIIANNNDNFE